MRGHWTRRAGVVAGVVATLLGFAPTGVAHAARNPLCPHPFVCLFDGGRRTGGFVETTDGWQYLDASRSANYVINTRVDDVVYVLFDDGSESCVPPDTTLETGHDIFDNKPLVRAVRISDQPECHVYA